MSAPPKHATSKPLGCEHLSRAKVLAVIRDHVRADGCVSPYTLSLYLDDGRIGQAAFLANVRLALQQRSENAS